MDKKVVATRLVTICKAIEKAQQPYKIAAEARKNDTRWGGKYAR